MSKSRFPLFRLAVPHPGKHCTSSPCSRSKSAATRGRGGHSNETSLHDHSSTDTVDTSFVTWASQRLTRIFEGLLRQISQDFLRCAPFGFPSSGTGPSQYCLQCKEQLCFHEAGLVFAGCKNGRRRLWILQMMQSSNLFGIAAGSKTCDV